MCARRQVFSDPTKKQQEVLGEVRSAPPPRLTLIHVRHPSIGPQIYRHKTVDAPIRDGKLEIDVGPFEIVTLKFLLEE